MITTLILNRGFQLPADNMYHISPIGEFPIFRKNDAGEWEEKIQVVDKQAIDEMVNRFNEEAKEKNFPGLLVDRDHFSLEYDKASEAEGWINKLEAREDGLWAEIRWTDLGLNDVKGGRYRLVSPVWDCRPLSNDKNEKRVRPYHLTNVAVTNTPNLKGLVPLSNRRDGNLENKNNNPPPKADNEGANNMLDYKSKLLKLLGLPAEATDEQIEAAMQNKRETSTELQNKYKKLLDNQVEATLEKFKSVIKNREVWKNQLTDNFDSALAALEGLNTESAPKPKQPLTNRGTAGNPGERTVNAGDDESPEAKALEKQKADWIQNRAQELLKNSNKNRGLSECWRQATVEAEVKPEFKK